MEQNITTSEATFIGDFNIPFPPTHYLYLYLIISIISSYDKVGRIRKDVMAMEENPIDPMYTSGDYLTSYRFASFNLLQDTDVH